MKRLFGPLATAFGLASMLLLAAPARAQLDDRDDLDLYDDDFDTGYDVRDRRDDPLDPYDYRDRDDFDLQYDPYDYGDYDFDSGTDTFDDGLLD